MKYQQNLKVQGFLVILTTIFCPNAEFIRVPLERFRRFFLSKKKLTISHYLERGLDHIKVYKALGVDNCLIQSWVESSIK